MVYPQYKGSQGIPYNTSLVVYVSDGMDSVSASTVIRVTDDHPPDLVKTMDDLYFEEDRQVKGAYTLDEHFRDIDGDTMFYTSGNINIKVLINANHTVDFSAPPNWFGSEYLTIRASDSEGAFVEDTILVTVLPINDAPVVSELPLQVGERGIIWVLDLEDYISDVDSEKDNLTVTVDSPYVSVVGHVIIFEYPDNITEDSIWIRVGDGELETPVPLDVSIVSSAVPDEGSNLFWYLLTLVLVSILALVLVTRRGFYTIEDLFLITSSGLLITHVGRNKKMESMRDAESGEVSHSEGIEQAETEESFPNTNGEEKDEDILASMFVAVQQFVKDAFANDDNESLKRMDYGDKTVLIYKGEYVILSAFITGQASKSLHRRMEILIEDVEERYGGHLVRMGGGLGELEGADQMLTSILEGKYTKGSWKNQSNSPE
jgi:hypothetical protein